MRRLHCRKFGSGDRRLSGRGLQVSFACVWLGFTFAGRGNGQQKGRPGGSPSRYVGGYAPYGLAHTPPREGRDGRPIAHEGDEGKPETRAAVAARRHGRERCRAGVREGRVEEESHTGGVRPWRIGQSPNGRKGYMTNFCDV